MKKHDAAVTKVLREAGDRGRRIWEELQNISADASIGCRFATSRRRWPSMTLAEEGTVGPPAASEGLQKRIFVAESASSVDFHFVAIQANSLHANLT